MSRLHHLQSNLIEIHSFLSECDGELVAEPIWGQTLYHSSYGWGRFWKWFYKIAAFFGNETLSAQKYENALETTQRLFREAHDKTLHQAERYCRHFEESASNTDERELAKARYKILLWREVTTSTLKLRRSSNSELLMRILPQSIAQDITNQHHKLKDAFQVITLESVCKGNVPFKLLQNEASSIRTESATDVKRLRAFAKKLNKIEPEYNVGRAVSALKAFVNISNNQSTETPKNLTPLLMALIEQGYQGITKTDPKHLHKRGNLVSGNQVYCNNQRLIIRNCIHDMQGTKIYSLLNAPYWLEIGPNKGFHQVKKLTNTRYEWGVPSSKYLDIDADGKCACIEPFAVSLYNYPWKPLSGGPDTEEQALLKPIANLLKWFFEQEKFPLNLSARYLGYMNDGAMKSLKSCIASRLRFNDVIDFIIDISNGNFKVYRYLIANSNIRQHRSVRFFRILIEESMLEPGRTSSRVIAAACLIDDGAVVKRGDEFLQKLHAIKQRCCTAFATTLQRQGGVYIPEHETLIARALVRTLVRLGPTGVIPPTFEELVLLELQ